MRYRSVPSGVVVFVHGIFTRQDALAQCRIAIKPGLGDQIRRSPR